MARQERAVEGQEVGRLHLPSRRRLSRVWARLDGRWCTTRSHVIPVLSVEAVSAAIAGTVVSLGAGALMARWAVLAVGGVAGWALGVAAAVGVEGAAVWMAVDSWRSSTFEVGGLAPLWEFVNGQLGGRYRQGGTGGVEGWDGVNLVAAAYRAVDVDLVGGPAAQYAQTATTAVAVSPELVSVPGRRRSAVLQPGDLIFWGSDPADPATITQVAIYAGRAGRGLVVRFGAPAQVRHERPIYHGDGRVTMVGGDHPMLQLGPVWAGWHWVTRPADLATGGADAQIRVLDPRRVGGRP